MGGKCDNKEGYSNREHPFPRVSRYKKDDIKEGDIPEIVNTLYFLQRNTSRIVESFVVCNERRDIKL